jgi:hypothetical protein
VYQDGKATAVREAQHKRPSDVSRRRAAYRIAAATHRKLHGLSDVEGQSDSDSDDLERVTVDLGNYFKHSSDASDNDEDFEDEDPLVTHIVVPAKLKRIASSAPTRMHTGSHTR